MVKRANPNQVFSDFVFFKKHKIEIVRESAFNKDGIYVGIVDDGVFLCKDENVQQVVTDLSTGNKKDKVGDWVVYFKNGNKQKFDWGDVESLKKYLITHTV